MKAKSIKSPERHGTLSASTLIPTLTNNSLGNGSVTNTNCNILARDMCTSPIQVRINNLQNGISSGVISSLPTKDTTSLEGLENSMYEAVSPSHTSNSSPFVRSSSSNSNSSLTLSTNCNTGSGNHTMSTILNPIENGQEDGRKGTESPLTLNYSPPEVDKNRKDDANDVR